MRVEQIGLATLYLADCRDILPKVTADVLITDPVWPNCPPGLLVGGDGTQDQLLRAAVDMLPTIKTAVICLGFDSDPRWLSRVVPERLPFIRSQQMPYAMPGYRGRLLGGDEIAYVFGVIPKGVGVIPGRARTETESKSKRSTGHPCPRSDTHMKSLVGWWSTTSDVVIDPFLGSGATGVAAVSSQRRFIGIEIEPTYFDLACRRIEQAQKQLHLEGIPA